MNTLRKGYVYVQDIYAGTLSETDEGYCFSYDESHLKKKRCQACFFNDASSKRALFFKKLPSAREG